jgi:phosphoglycerate dehydrogenase-like enzyme
MHKLLILSKQADVYRKLIEAAALPALEIATQPDPRCDLIFGEPNLIAPAIIDLPRLIWVQATWAGVEPLLDPQLRRDYTLTNARGVFGALMSEYVIGYLLLHERKILQRLESQKQNRWDNQITGSLRGKTIGILGVGSIGSAVARTAKFFDMTVRGYTRESETSKHVDRYYHGDELFSFVENLDYLVSVLPNTKDTRKIISAELLSHLSSSSIFINVGRGSAVDEPALAEALITNQIAAAVLDVFDQEPLPADHIFWRAPNTIITSHTSAPSLPNDIAALFIENYQRLINGEPLKYVVNFEQGY